MQRLFHISVQYYFIAGEAAASSVTAGNAVVDLLPAAQWAPASQWVIGPRKKRDEWGNLSLEEHSYYPFQSRLGGYPPSSSEPQLELGNVWTFVQHVLRPSKVRNQLRNIAKQETSWRHSLVCFSTSQLPDLEYGLS